MSKREGDKTSSPGPDKQARLAETPKLIACSCACGAVKWDFDASKMLWTGFCHCNSCRTAHMSPVAWALGFKLKDVHVPTSEHLDHYKVTEKGPKRHFCKKCGSRIFVTMDEYDYFGVPAMSVTDKTWLKSVPPTVHCCYVERVIDMKDGLPKYRLFPPMGSTDKGDVVPE